MENPKAVSGIFLWVRLVNTPLSVSVSIVETSVTSALQRSSLFLILQEFVLEFAVV